MLESVHFIVHKNKQSSKEFPYLVFDSKGNLHLPLNRFVRYLAERYAPNTLRNYLSAVVTYFSWIAARQDTEQRWSEQPEKVRLQVMDYLFLKFSCQVRDHRTGIKLVVVTNQTASSIATFLSAIKAFYAGMIAEEVYIHTNPLIGLSIQSPLDAGPHASSILDKSFPSMPTISGVAQHVPEQKRLSDSYFIVLNEQWVPQVIDDPSFPTSIINAGIRFGWNTREVLVTRMLFETGARVNEICNLTVGDWYGRGLKNEAAAINKGSGQRRVKFVRWSDNTTKLLRQYFDSVRVTHDRQHFTLADYINHSPPAADLLSIPLFLTSRGTPLSANTFRNLYWRPACKDAKIDADIHQARHWYVTMAIREIHSTGLPKDEMERRVNDLIQYMNWKSGRSTLDAYEHFFSRQRHAVVQDALHRKLDRELRSTSRRPLTPILKKSESTIPDDDELDFLMRLGGQVNA